MAAAPLTPRRAATGRRRGRPPGSTNAARAARLAAVNSEPPPKRRKYIPGGPGGGGRFVDEDGTVTHVVRGSVGGSGGGGRAGVGSGSRGGRGRSQRSTAAAAGASPSLIPRRARSTRTRIAVSRYEPDDEEHFSSAAAVAAAVAQSEGYKPREERGWEEFHPNLDIETTFMVFRSDEVDGTSTAAAAVVASGAAENVDGTTIEASAPDAAGPLPSGGVLPLVTSDLGQPETPLRRRLGRPPRDGAVVSYAYGTGATPKKPKVLPIHNQTPKEKLDLKLPSYRRSNRIQLFENKTLSRYVDKSMMNVGYQETDVYIRPERYLLKASDANAEEEVDAYHTAVAAAVAAEAGNNKEPSSTTATATEENNAAEPPTSYGVPGSAISQIISGGGAGSNGGVGRVEYDMDEQDDMWLSKYNEQRKAANVEAITREIFEITITKIEKEWHLLEKRIPKPNPKPPQTHRARSGSAAAVNGEMVTGEELDSKCAICDDGDCENTNAIVFCDGCDLAVHQDCYGVPFIPEGQWLCRKCQLIGRGVPTCIFCPNTDGAFKQTNSSKWAHMLCAMWIPETSLGNTTFMEPVMDVDKVPKTRWRLTCYICRQKMGACIQCGNKACYQAFHVTCARRARLYLRMKNSQGALAVLDNSMVLKAFCDRHCPPEYAKENGVHQATRDAKRHYKRTMRGRIWADSRASALQMAATTAGMLGMGAGHAAAESQMTGARIAAAAAAAAAAAGVVPEPSTAEPGVDSVVDASGDNKKTRPMWKLPSGAPVIPQAVFDIVETALQRFMLRRRREYVSEACRYWTLKREARRGAALLKRLQLQMETFTSMELTRRNFAAMGPSGHARLERRIAFAEALIRDLDQLRALAHDVVERERTKRAAAELEHDFVDACYFPVFQLLAPIVDKASTYDKGVFRAGLATLQDKLNSRYYTTTLAFARDLADVVSGVINADADDARDRKRLGKRILKSIQPMLEAAVRAEADIARVPLGPLQAELEQLLEACVEVKPAAAAASAACITVSPADAEAEIVANGDPMDIDKDDKNDKNDIKLTTPRASRHKTTSIPATTPQSSIVLVNGENVGVAANGTAAGLLTNGDSVAANGTAVATNGDVANGDGKLAAAATDAPLTPPQSHNGSLPAVTNGHDEARPLVETLDAGGVLWYLGGFSPHGTTASDAPLWAEAVTETAVQVNEPGAGTNTPVGDGNGNSNGTTSRHVSEDLTDMDDDELRGLAFDVEDSTITAEAAAAAAATGAATGTTKASQNLAVTTPKRRGAGPFRKGVRSSARRR